MRQNIKPAHGLGPRFFIHDLAEMTPFNNGTIERALDSIGSNKGLLGDFRTMAEKKNVLFAEGPSIPSAHHLTLAHGPRNALMAKLGKEEGSPLALLNHLAMHAYLMPHSAIAEHRVQVVAPALFGLMDRAVDLNKQNATLFPTATDELARMKRMAQGLNVPTQSPSQETARAIYTRQLAFCR